MNKDNKDKDNICSICLETINDKYKNHTVTQCGHLFHTTCLLTSCLKSNKQCPNCRTLLSESFENESFENAILSNANLRREKEELYERIDMMEHKFQSFRKGMLITHYHLLMLSIAIYIDLNREN